MLGQRLGGTLLLSAGQPTNGSSGKLSAVTERAAAVADVGIAVAKPRTNNADVVEINERCMPIPLMRLFLPVTFLLLRHPTAPSRPGASHPPFRDSHPTQQPSVVRRQLWPRGAAGSGSPSLTCTSQPVGVPNTFNCS
jgi:hypothetical protein